MIASEKTSVPHRLQTLLSSVPVGERLPGEQALAKLLGTSRPTLRNALARYAQQGIIESRPGDGTYLRRSVTGPEESPQAVSTVGVVVRRLASGWHPRAVAALQADDRGRDLHLVLKSSEESAQQEIEQLLQLSRSGIRRIITFPAVGNLFSPEYRKLLQTLASSRVRVVLVDNPVFGVDLPCVSTDHAQSGYLATRHLIDHGHRSILIAGAFAQGGATHRERLNGYLNALQSVGVQPDPRHCLDIGPNEGHREAGYRVTKAYIERYGQDFTAVFATRDELAWGAVRALREHDIDIPNDVSVVGFGDDARDEAFGVLLTSLEHPLDQIAHQALELLADDQAWPDISSCRYLFPARMVERESVRKIGP